MAGHTDKQKIATSVLQMILLKKSFTVFSHQNKVCSISSIRIFDQFRQEHYNNFPGFTPKPKVVKFLYFSQNGKIILLSFQIYNQFSVSFENLKMSSSNDTQLKHLNPKQIAQGLSDGKSPSAKPLRTMPQLNYNIRTKTRMVSNWMSQHVGACILLIVITKWVQTQFM